MLRPTMRHWYTDAYTNYLAHAYETLYTPSTARADRPPADRGRRRLVAALARTDRPAVRPPLAVRTGRAGTPDPLRRAAPGIGIVHAYSLSSATRPDLQAATTLLGAGREECRFCSAGVIRMVPRRAGAERSRAEAVLRRWHGVHCRGGFAPVPMADGRSQHAGPRTEVLGRGEHRDVAVHLTPHEQERLMIHLAADVAEKRRARGCGSTTPRPWLC